MEKAVFFDLDGTLLNTLADLRGAVNYVLEKRGLEPLTMEQVRRYVGNGAVKLLLRALPEGQYDETALEDFKTWYNAHSRDETKPYPGILPALQTLKARGFRMAVLSNKPDWAVGALCRAYFGDLIEVAIGERPDCPKKPAPDMLIRAAEEMGIPLGDVIYVGDSEVDVQTARNAGIPCLSVLWGFRDREEIRAEGGSLFCGDPSLLVEKLEEMIRGK